MSSTSVRAPTFQPGVELSNTRALCDSNSPAAQTARPKPAGSPPKLTAPGMMTAGGRSQMYLLANCGCCVTLLPAGKIALAGPIRR